MVLKGLKKGLVIGTTILALAGCGDILETKHKKEPSLPVTCCRPPESNPIIISNIIEYTKNETGQNIIYRANVIDPDGDLSSVSLRIRDGVNDILYPMTNTSGDNYEKNLVFTDGCIIEAEVFASDAKGLYAVGDYNYLPIYLSEQDGQGEIENTVNSFIFSGDPTSTGTDITDVVNGTNIESDVALYFENNLEYNGIPGNKALIYLNYISKEDDPVNAENDMNVLNLEPYFNGIGIPNAYINFDNLGIPINRQDIGGIVNSILTNEDLKIQYL